MSHFDVKPVPWDPNEYPDADYSIPWWKERLWWPICDFFRPIHIWWLDHVWIRYHKLDLRSSGDYYKTGYLDPGHVLLLASFRALELYVEELALHREAWGGTHLPLEDYDFEAVSLYNWWTDERRQNYDALARDPEYSWEKRDELEETDTEMLRRLVELHRRMWT